MSKIAALTLAAALAIPATVALASESGKEGDVKLDLATVEQIRTMLTEAGYEAGEIEAEDGVIEVEATKDGAVYEMTLNANLDILETELEDDEDDEDEDDD